jgi:phage baseplate assembly protein W
VTELSVDFIGIGWAYPLGVRHNGAIATVDGVANLERAMRIVLTTYLGERPMRPDFGSRLRDYLFDGMSAATLVAIEEEVARALYSCEPRVEIDDVTATAAPDTPGRVDIEISYTVLATNDAANLVVPFYTIPGEGDTVREVEGVMP